MESGTTKKHVVIGLACVHCGPQSKWKWLPVYGGPTYICECGGDQYDLVFTEYQNNVVCKRVVYSTSGAIKQVEEIPSFTN